MNQHLFNTYSDSSESDETMEKVDIEAALGQSQQNATDQAMSVTSSEIAAAMEEVHQEMARISKSKNFSLYSFRLSYSDSPANQCPRLPGR